MRMNKNTKIITGSVVALAVIVVLGLVYAAFTQQLTINGTATGRSSSWKIYFSRLTSPILNGTAKELTAPTIKNNSTTIGDYSVSVTSPGDYIEYEFDVTNDGDYDATLSNLSINSASSLTYVGSGDNKTNDENNVKSQIEYTLKYKSDGTTVSQDDTLKSKETKTMLLRLTYKTFNDASLLPQADVAISGLGISLTYTQDGNAKVNADGSTPYVAPQPVYSVGDRIQVAGDKSGDYYRVIAASGSTQDYVVALKENPLSVDEVNTYGTGHVNMYINYPGGSDYQTAIDTEDDNHSGGMAYYSSPTCGIDDYSVCTNNYDQSDVKYVVDAWAQGEIGNTNLELVGGYRARLITVPEYQTLSSYAWRCDEGYEYYIMTAADEPDYINIIDYWGYLSATSVAFGSEFGYPVVRPVINLKKSAITQ